ncbi:MAG: nucleoside triphosphate pyrophosphohydrolase, partial [Gammaproteobacteria bacterium]|nr:nucleoside triphosphate pyrophosphohydrolase [Gammaproteobacteria bacterium]NIR98068.1 nucleoside triphosphate pyrophosphohydrolase [Gammaproteobacteria bacterium]NIT63778.1 nucleoside triphosphate pyrophosphohydrolase [Gammaproteobacteria bacterium]NIV20728.1 nucleoside triphosphate pyrophosphohydrolase [Gammaproteobacteria bacterium]NIY32358.1 nucleoside triphosphate pyrophosphohydrolase [Gammaproteobacteria bacterium]
YTLEEAYEVAEAVERGEDPGLREELGDLLFQVVFYAQIAAEEHRFDFDDVAGAIADKMERRHPHVFGDAEVADERQQNLAWEAHKQHERAGEGREGALDGVPRALPALVRAYKLQGRAARVGFDWERDEQVLEKVQEELAELQDELAAAAPPARLEEELGDLLFSCVNLARRLEVDAEGALRRANDKFERRFRAMERRMAGGPRPVGQADLQEMDRAWELVKAQETPRPG